MARIVFDLDGTLIDSAPDIHAVANKVLSEEGCAPITLQDTQNFVGNGAAVFVARMRAARDLPDSEQDRLYQSFVSRYETAVSLTRLYPGVTSALETLTTTGAKLGLCTNKPIRPTRAVLDHFDLTKFFPVVYGGDSFERRKPDPLPLQNTLAALGEGAQIFVGDSEVDAETAQRAGVPFLLFTEGYRKTPAASLPHHANFSDFANLPDLIAQVRSEI
ncbi:MAG: phosphoglycolate phosphatase [Pelagimonas sp.]|jgi:phosphoglycolate phosphatase|nr:phosphoglycolate phosphatase [Pelagimonas sp.]